MSYAVEFTPTSIDSLQNAPSTIQERVLRKIRWLSENFDDTKHQSLTANLSDLFKLRVGDYRVIYSFDVEIELVTIHKIGHRRDVYD